MSESVRSRNRSQEHHDRAYDVQFNGGVKGAITWTIFAAAACTLAHFTFPVFRKQTLGLKAFLTSSVVGLTVGADRDLLKYEAETRRNENALRRLARNELAKEGIIASEGEIRKWREVYERRMTELKKPIGTDTMVK